MLWFLGALQPFTGYPLHLNTFLELVFAAYEDRFCSSAVCQKMWWARWYCLVDSNEIRTFDNLQVQPGMQTTPLDHHPALNIVVLYFYLIPSSLLLTILILENRLLAQKDCKWLFYDLNLPCLSKLVTVHFLSSNMTVPSLQKPPLITQTLAFWPVVPIFPCSYLMYFVVFDKIFINILLFWGSCDILSITLWNESLSSYMISTHTIFFWKIDAILLTNRGDM